MGHGVLSGKFFHRTVTLIVVAAAAVIPHSVLQAEALKTYSGNIQIATPCHLLPGGADALCIQQAIDFSARIQFRVGRTARLVTIGANGKYSVRLPGGALSAKVKSLRVSLNGRSLVFDGNKIRLTGIGQAITGKSRERTDYLVRHKDFSAAGSSCSGGTPQGIEGEFVTGNRMPIVCDGGGGCVKPIDKAVPGVTVEAINESTGAEFTTVTDKDGHYLFSELPAGNYTLRGIYTQGGGVPLSDSSLQEQGLPVLCDALTSGDIGFFSY